MRTRLAAAFALSAAFTFAVGAQAASTAVPQAKLSLMVLPKAELGAASSGLQVAFDSGPIDNATDADNTTDQSDSASDRAKAGRVTGYVLRFNDLPASALERGRGVVSVETSVDVFRSAAAASKDIAHQLRDLQRFQGRVIEFGVALARVTRFTVRGLGDEAFGIAGKSFLGDKRLHWAGVVFRRGTLTAGTSITRADATATNAQMVQLARKLDRRVSAVLAGAPGLRPTTIPSTSPAGRRPSGAPDLAAMALRVADLPRGTMLSSQAYVASGDTLSSYEREFGRTQVGGTALTGIASALWLQRPGEAAGTFFTLSEIYSSTQAPAYFNNLRPGVVTTLGERGALDAGDEAYGIVFSFSLTGTTAVLIHVRVGRVLGTISAATPARAIHLAPFQRFARIMAARMRAGGA